jgi:hypothetical protein
MGWTVDISQEGADAFVIRISVHNLKTFMMQFICSFSLQMHKTADTRKNIVIVDTANDNVFAIKHEKGIVQSILFSKTDDSAMCLLEGDPKKLTHLGEFLLEIVKKKRLPKMLSRKFSMFIPALSERSASATRRRRPSIHDSLTNADLQSLVELDISGPNWSIKPGNVAEKIPSGLLPKPRSRPASTRKMRR